MLDDNKVTQLLYHSASSLMSSVVQLAQLKLPFRENHDFNSVNLDALITAGDTQWGIFVNKSSCSDHNLYHELEPNGVSHNHQF